MDENRPSSEIDYEKICKIAKLRSLKLPPSIDWRDLAQEAATKVLAGRQSITGPMQDLLRKGLVGDYRYRHTLQVVDASKVNLVDSSIRADDQVSAKEAITQVIYDPVLKSRERRLLKGILTGTNLALLAKRRKISESRVNQILADVKRKLNDGNKIGLHELYIRRGLSIQKIAGLLGTGKHTVWTALKRYGIERRPAKVMPSTVCIECGRALHKKRRCKFHYGQWLSGWSKKQWAKVVEKRGPVTFEQRSVRARRTWETRRERYGEVGYRTKPVVPREVRSMRTKLAWATRREKYGDSGHSIDPNKIN